MAFGGAGSGLPALAPASVSLVRRSTWAAGTIRRDMVRKRSTVRFRSGPRSSNKFSYTEPRTIQPEKCPSSQLNTVIVAMSWRSAVLTATCEGSGHRNGYAVLEPAPCRPKANLRVPCRPGRSQMMIGLSRRKHLYESHCLALQWLPLRAVTSTRIAAQSTSDRSPIPYGWQLGLSSGAAAHRSSTLVLSISREGGVVVRRGGSRSGSAQEAIDPLLAKIVGPDA